MDFGIICGDIPSEGPCLWLQIALGAVGFCVLFVCCPKAAMVIKLEFENVRGERRFGFQFVTMSQR